MYIMYFFIVYLLCIIDISVLIYYIFWINNIFINPLLWLCLKILFYNKTILLLLLFYYYIAKYTIRESGYSYVQFFNIDIRKWRSIYFNYFWNITTYHIEIISIFIFFIVITIPLFLHNKEYIILLISLIVFFLILFRIMKNRFLYVINKKVNLMDLLFIWFIVFISIKVMNHHNFKDILMTYIHMDKWVFDLLEWKILTYDKIMEKDYYSETVGLKPIWVGKKINKDLMIDKKIWENFNKKPKKKLIDEFNLKMKITKKKCYLYTKYIHKVFKVKNMYSSIKLQKIKKEYLNAHYDNKYNDVVVKEFTPKVNTKNENPVVTMEKERERILHQTILFGKIFEFSINTYYDLNLYLNDLTFHTLYNQPFTDPNSITKQIIEEKRSHLFYYLKDKIGIKDELALFNAILKKIEKNENILKKELLDLSLISKKDNLLLHKLLDYIIIKKKDNLLIKKLLIKFNVDEKKKLEIRGKLNTKKLLIQTKNDLQFDKKFNKLNFLNKSISNILKNDKLDETKSKYNYIEKKKIENSDNQILLNTVKKYNEGKTNIIQEFSDVYISRDSKDDWMIKNGPDLSRRNKK